MSPDKVQARKMVLVSAFLLAGIAVYRDRSSGASDTFHALWGVGVVALLLSILADFAPTIAGPFAALTVLGSLTSGGTSIIDKLLGTVSSKPAAPKAAPSGNTKPSAAATAHNH
jgi:hypothetical protein